MKFHSGYLVQWGLIIVHCLKPLEIVHGFLQKSSEYPKPPFPTTSGRSFFQKEQWIAVVGKSSYYYNTKATRLYKKWSPRWNPRPDSDYYGGKDKEDIFGGIIDSSSQRRKRSQKFHSKFHRSRFYSLQRLLVVSFIPYSALLVLVPKPPHVQQLIV